MTWFPDPEPAPTALVYAGSRATGSRPQILSGLGEEGGEPLDAQARGLRVGWLPLVFSIKSFYSSSLAFPWKQNIQGWAVPTIQAHLVGTAHPKG